MPSTYLDGATFGVELECYLPEQSSQQQVTAAVTQRLGGTSRCMVEAYNHNTRGHWKLVTDGSLEDYARGIELVSPILSGEQGLQTVGRVCDALSDFGCTVAKKCGLHVHVGARNQPLWFFKNLIKLYGMFEPVIDSMMPPSRRAGAGTYCRSIASVSADAINRAQSFQSLVLTATPGATPNERRFYKVNLEAHGRHGTVEFRQHSGTLSAEKARQWVIFCLKMVAAAKNEFLFASREPQAATNAARPGSKTHAIGQLMMRPQGVTRTEVMATLNWPSVSLPNQARLCGLTYTTQRTGREVRYFANAGAVSAQATITIGSFAEMIGLTDGEQRYMQERTADLGGAVAWAA